MSHFFTKNPVPFQRLQLVQIPEETETHVPVGHDWVALQSKEIGCAYLGDYKESQYGLSKDGMQMFGIHRFSVQHALKGEVEVALGFRNSYNKTLSIGIVGGLCVLVCDNLMLTGEVKRTRRHTGSGVWQTALNNMEFVARSLAADQTVGFIGFVEEMKSIQLSDREAFQFLGLARGEKVLRSTQETNAFKEWGKPRHQCWEDRTAWSLYNACTEALKSCGIQEITDRYLALNSLAMSEWAPQFNGQVTPVSGADDTVAAIIGDVSSDRSERFRSISVEMD